jgi:EAL domain-containing protein (putative c-di-GMP-specific phosphodiesterase class I)
LVAAVQASSALIIGEEIANAAQLTLAVQSGVDFVQGDLIDEPRHEISGPERSGGIST